METPFVLILHTEAECAALQELTGLISDTGPIREFYDEIFHALNKHREDRNLYNILDGRVVFTKKVKDIEDLEEITKL